MGLKEILAAKRAAMEAANPTTTETKDELNAPAQSEANIDSTPVEAASEPTQESAVSVSPLDLSSATSANQSEVSGQSEQSSTAGPLSSVSESGSNGNQSSKPLTFAEKMALKKQGIQQAQTQVVPKKETVIDPEMIPENPEDAQAYVDIKHRIDALEALFEDDLKNAMTELKVALKKNPNAAELMLDADVGKMVIALRKMTHTAQVEAETAPKKGKAGAKTKAKDVQLTAEQIAAAFEEL